MLKKILSIIVCCIFLLTLCSCNKSLVTDLSDYEWEEDSDGNILITHIPDAETVTIASIVEGQPIYGIKTSSQKFNTLKNLIIPSGVKIIDRQSFEGCQTLESVTIKEGLFKIEEGAFAGCHNLANIELANSIESIGSNAFIDCAAKSLILPSHLKELGTLAVASSSLTNITIKNGEKYKVKDGWIMSKDGTELLMRTVGPANSDKLQGVFNIPEGVTTLGNCAFLFETYLTEIIVPSTLKNIGEYAFAGCTGLKSLQLPDKMDYIGDGAFAEMTGLTDFEFPSVPQIGDYVMEGCTSLKNLSFVSGDMPVTFGIGAFKGCPLDSNIQLPANTLCLSYGSFDLNGGTIIVPDTLKNTASSAILLKNGATVKYRGTEYSDSNDFVFAVMLFARDTPADGAKSIVNLDITSGVICATSDIFHIGDSLRDIVNAGWNIDARTIKSIESGSIDRGIILHKDKNSVTVDVFNDTDSLQNVLDCALCSITLDCNKIKNGSFDGIKLNRAKRKEKRDDIAATFGLPDEMFSRSEDRVYDSYTYRFDLQKTAYVSFYFGFEDDDMNTSLQRITICKSAEN